MKRKAPPAAVPPVSEAFAFAVTLVVEQARSTAVADHHHQ